jgi:hypothetical protein
MTAISSAKPQSWSRRLSFAWLALHCMLRHTLLGANCAVMDEGRCLIGIRSRVSMIRHS